MPHFLQSEAWAGFQAALGKTVAEGHGDGWSYRAYLERGRLNSRLYAPYGPVADSPEALAEALAAMRADAKRLGAAFLRVEPTGGVPADALPALGLRRVARKQPEHTQRIDIDRPFDEVLAGFQSSLRNRHRNYRKKGLSVRRSADPADVEHLIRLLGSVVDRTGMHAHSPEYLRATANALVPGGHASIYLVDLEGEELPIAASLVFDDAACRYYAHAAADTAHRGLHPGPILVSQMIEDATAGPQREFDLYGVVPPEVKDHPWSGFSEFKRSFGGSQLDYSGTWELPVKRLDYAVYSLARRVVGD